MFQITFQERKIFLDKVVVQVLAVVGDVEVEQAYLKVLRVEPEEALIMWVVLEHTQAEGQQVVVEEVGEVREVMQLRGPLVIR